MSDLWKKFLEKHSPAVQQSPVDTLDMSAFVNQPVSLTPGPQSALLHGADGISLDINSNVTNTTPWYNDGEAMSGYAGLASTLLQAAALPEQLKLAKTQRKSLEQNLTQAKADSAFRDTARSNFNKTSGAI